MEMLWSLARMLGLFGGDAMVLGKDAMTLWW
jgi:hypothetical protein